MPVEPTVMESALAPVASSAVTEVSTEPAMKGMASTQAPTVAAARAEATGKRVRWTREAIIDELARWMASGTMIDASFVRRHGPKGLVPATLRIFGRFDAALNVAGLHVAKLYPDGPPGR